MTIPDERLRAELAEAGELNRKLTIYRGTLEGFETKLVNLNLSEWKRRKYLRQKEQIARKVEETERRLIGLFNSIEVGIKNNTNGKERKL